MNLGNFSFISVVVAPMLRRLMECLSTHWLCLGCMLSYIPIVDLHPFRTNTSLVCVCIVVVLLVLGPVHNPRNVSANAIIYNGIIWSSVKLALKSGGFVSQWECVLPQHAFHSICSSVHWNQHSSWYTFLLFKDNVRFPVWARKKCPGPCCWSHGRSSKYDPVVEVDLVHACNAKLWCWSISFRERVDCFTRKILLLQDIRMNNFGRYGTPLHIAENVKLPETASEDQPDTDDVAAEPTNIRWNHFC